MTQVLKRNPLKITTMLLAVLLIAGAGHWLTTGRFMPQAHAHPGADSIASLGTFEEVLQIYRTLRQQGASHGDLSAAVAQWMDAHEWRRLTVGELAELWNMLSDDLVTTRTECSARWMGTITAPLTDTYTFSNVFHSTADVQIRVWVDGQLVLQPAPPETIAASGSSLSTVANQNDPDAAGDRSTPIALQAAQTAPIVVELSVFTPHLRRNWGYPIAMLYWEGRNLPRTPVPSAVFSPPEGGGDGLKAELYDGPAFNQLVQTRLDPAVDIACIASPFAPAQLDKQRAVLAELWPKLLAADFAGLVNDDFNEPARVVHRVGAALSLAQKRQVLDLMIANPPAIQALDPDSMLAVFVATKHAPGDGIGDFIATWCDGQSGDLQFGSNDGANARDSYERRNHYHFMAVGRWMAKEFPDRLDRLEQQCLEREDGSCRPAVASILTHGYLERGAMSTWLDRIDAMLEDPSIAGDARATWLFARAFAEEMRSLNVRPLAGIDWLIEAMAEATSEPMQFAALQHLIVRLGSMDRGDWAIRVLDGVQGQFSTPGRREAMSAWRVEIDRLAAGYEILRAEAAALANADHLDELQCRLADAQARHDDEDVQRYQHLLQSLPP